MSVYRYQIRNNFTNLTGGTIDPMLNPATGTQEFTSYLTTYSNKPGQNFSNDTSPVNFAENYFLKPLFNNIKDLLNNGGIQEFYDITNQGILISSGATIDPKYNYKNINIPVNLKIEPADYSDDINSFIKREKLKSINPIIDGERVKYLTTDYQPITINFRFYNKNSDSFVPPGTNTGEGYQAAGFLPSEIGLKNNFKKSYFRLYFYDNNDTKTQNLLLTEDISTYGSTIPSFNFSKIFWLKNDPVFSSTTIINRRVYMEARFFNAKTGRVHRFINTPLSVSFPVNISILANNQSWKSSKILILNPKLNNGNRYFEIDQSLPLGANTTNSITFTEYVLEV
jgi:hypothetical protein